MSKLKISDGCGCFTLIITIVLIWALVFGVTVNGKHYGLNQCTCEKGVVIDK